MIFFLFLISSLLTLCLSLNWIRVCEDIEGTMKDGTKQKGFGMDGYLKSNLDDIIKILKLAYDCFAVISGHGKVRIGKSSQAMQIGSYVAWLLAGGRVRCHQELVEGKQRWITKYVVKPKRKVKFDLHENVAFSADELQEKAFKLYDKYGKNQVLVYDEGRQGLDSARAMEAINKGMEDFVQACGFMGHVVIIVLPNFFKLHEDYAVARSWFLIDVYSNKQHQRGYFSFYNEEQKERLFYFGKKRIGIRAKYTSANENFWGKFSSWFPFDRDEYDRLKKESIKRIRRSKQQQKWKRQRDTAVYMVKKYSEMKSKEIAEELSILSRQKISERQIRYAIANISKQKMEEVD